MTWFDLNEMNALRPTSDMGVSREKTARNVARKKATEYCKLCGQRGKRIPLRLFQINAREALLLCSDPKCTYPMGLTNSSDIVHLRPSTAAKLPAKRKQSGTIPGHQAKQPRLSQSPKKNEPKPPPAIPLQTLSTSNSHFQTNGHIPCSTSVITKASVNTTHMKAQASDSYNMNGHDNSVFAVPMPPKAIADRCKVSKELKLPIGRQQTKAAGLHKPFTSSEFLQWKNRDNLCWLDVLLCLIVHSQQFKDTVCHSDNPVNSMMAPVLQAYKSAMDLVKTGTTPTHTENSSTSDVKNLVDVMQSQSHVPMNGKTLTNSTLKQAEELLSCERDQTWRRLEPKLRCVQGVQDSAVAALMVLLSAEPPQIQELCQVTYDLKVACEGCGLARVNRLDKRVLVIPATERNFSMAAPRFKSRCSKCHMDGQHVNLAIQGYPSVLFCHFVAGLNSKDSLSGLDFSSDADTRYVVRGLVQYKRKPDHFVAWIRDAER